MDDSKAQRQVGGSSSKSKAASKGSARKSSSKKKKTKKTPKSQNAGQPSGPAVSSSQRSKARSRSAVDNGGEESGSGEGVGSVEGTKANTYAVGATHVIDIGLGSALLIYGGMVHVGSVTAACVCYGLLLFLGAIAGAIGYYSGSCNRRGIVVSAVAGILACLLDIGAFIGVLFGWSGFISFLNDNHEALMLSEDSVKTIEGLKVLFVIIFIVLAALEVHR